MSKSNNTIDNLLVDKDPNNTKILRQNTDDLIAVNIYDNGNHIYTTSARNTRNNTDKV